MKLRKKMILIVSIATAVSMIAGGFVMMAILRRNMLRNAYSEAAVSAVDFFAGFERRLEIGGKEREDSSLALIYKNQDNWRNVIFREESEIYNITVFSRGELESVAYRREDGDTAGDNREELKYEDGLYIVNAKTVGDYDLYRLYDITDVHGRIRSMIMTYAAVAASMLLIVILAAAFALRKVLQPLKDLTDATNDMAGGDYSRRVAVTSRDELGSLAVHFNDMAEAVEKNQRTLRESEEQKTLMMGNLSHELKTPMTAIAGYAETLLTTKLSEEQQNEALYYIYSETNRLGRLSNKMMRLLSLSEGDVVEKTDIDVEELFQGIRDTVSVKKKVHSVEVEMSWDAERIRTDGDLIRDVIINLVDNAIKASKPGGTVWVSLKEGILSVRDEGIGIPAEELSAITEPFYMVDKSRSRKEGGAGLGLSLTKLIMEKLGASMEIRSAVGEGTEVTIRGIG
ncbi:MAG: HAMP domain-containing histidine kinase [Eubacterium sp.]|nr:HAMP domain-containing histidine kinase [Eubacterium sp.]